MKKIIYALILSLVAVSGLVFANREIKTETPKKLTQKPIVISITNQCFLNALCKIKSIHISVNKSITIGLASKAINVIIGIIKKEHIQIILL